MSQQLTLGENPAEDIAKQKAELTEEKLEREAWLKKRDALEKEHKENYFDGSTTVILHEGKFYFYGDVEHCGREAIKHNARKIRNLMIQKKVKYGHKNCSDLPTFENTYTDWEKFNHDRTDCYKDDLYVFEGDEIKVAKLIGDSEQTQIYCLDEEEVEQ